MFSSRLYSSSFWFILFFLPAFSFPFILRYFFFLTLLSLRPCLFLFWYIFSLSLSSCILPSFISLSFSLLPSLSFFLQLPSLCSLLSFFFFFFNFILPLFFPPHAPDPPPHLSHLYFALLRFPSSFSPLPFSFLPSLLFLLLLPSLSRPPFPLLLLCPSSQTPSMITIRQP